jgi:cell division protease FtsH
MPDSAERANAPETGSPRQPGQPHGGWRVLGALGRQWFLLLAIVLLVNWLVATCLAPSSTAPRLTIPYTTFKQQVQAGNVSSITSRGDQIQGTFKQAVPNALAGQETQGPSTATRSTQFQTQVPAFAAAELAALLAQSDVVVTAERPPSGPPTWLTVVLNFGPVLLLFGLLLWMGMRVQRIGGAGTDGHLLDIGRSRARRYDGSTGNGLRITFADVAGIDEAKADLEEVVDFLQHPHKYYRLGGRIPKGVLLVGPPGTGKTLLAKAVAGEASVPFFSLSGSEFVEMIVGVGAARVRDLFANAKKEAPAIIFIDELDAIGRRRGGVGFGGANQEQEQTLNQILTEMDGFDTDISIIVLAATNRPDVLDPALLRPGRFDRRVVVQRPDRIGREAILRVHACGVPLAKDVDLADIAAATPGLVGAELRNLINEAALEAARNDRMAVTRQDFTTALEKLTLGAARKLVMSEADRRRVAYHEAGHALLGLLLPDADPVQKVTIVPRGQALGATYQVPFDDRLNYGEPYLRARITGALGGRAAEALILGVVSTGAENDLRQATVLARQMVTHWGMSDHVGLIYVARPDDGFLGAEAMLGDGREAVGGTLADLVDAETQRIIAECYASAQEILTRERHRLVALAEALMTHESLDEASIRQVTALPKPADPPVPVSESSAAGSAGPTFPAPLAA